MYNFDYVDKDMIERTRLAAGREYLSDEALGVKEFTGGYLLPFNGNGGGSYKRLKLCGLLLRALHGGAGLSVRRVGRGLH